MKPERIKHYEKLGWKFIVEPYVDHHKGTDEEFHYIKSPRLDEPFLVVERYDMKRNEIILPWAWMSERQILAAEAERYANQLVDSYEFGGQLKAKLAKGILRGSRKITITLTLP